MGKMTTIKLEPAVKRKLDRYKQKDETYNAMIARLFRRHEIDKQLAEGYRVHAKRDLQIAKEREGTLLDGSDEW